MKSTLPRLEPNHAEDAAEDMSVEVRRSPMSYEAYLRDEHEARMEWVGGEVVVYMPPKAEHQRIVEFLYTLLNLFVQLSKLGLVRVAPFEVKLWAEGPSREPDIFFVAQNSLGKLSPERFSGAPELVVEVISPGSLYIDRNAKFKEYERAGVREYWLIDSRPDKTSADFFRLGDTDRYDLFATETEEVVTSAVVEGFELRPEWLWDASVNPLSALAEIVGRDALFEALQGEQGDSQDESERTS